MRIKYKVNRAPNPKTDMDIALGFKSGFNSHRK